MADKKEQKVRGDNKETFEVVMPNSPDMAANYRKANNEPRKSK